MGKTIIGTLLMNPDSFIGATIMKNLFISLFVLVATISFQSAYADSRGLERTEINKVLEPLRSDINRCYLANTGGLHGQMDLELEISGYGSVQNVKVSAPAVRNKSVAAKINACVQGIVKQLTFPKRKASTIAQFSYAFHKAHAPGDGPQLSCWNPRGCPGQ
jgi:hypothetical protein